MPVHDLITSIEDPSGRLWTYDYDDLGALAAATNPLGQAHNWTYEFGRLVTEERPDGGTVVYEYDGAGRPAAMTDPLGRTTSYAYDALGRRIRADYPAGDGGVATERIELDRAGRTTAAIDGSWLVRLPWRRGGAVRATAAGITSKPLEVDVTPILSTHKAAKRVHAGSAIHLTGRVRPATKVSIRLERQGSDGRFRRVRFLSARVSKTNWGASVRLRRPGLYRLTARAAGAEGRAVYVRAVRLTGGASAAA